jgi:acyl-CoA synthetase (AMP-forming)/AMP-acid ligase II
MPLYHSAASCIAVCGALFSGAAVAIGRRFSTKTFWNEVRESDATIIQYVGETCRYLTVAPPELDPVTGESLDKKHRVRVAMGNGLRPDVWDRFKKRFGIDVSRSRCCFAFLSDSATIPKY